MSLSHLTTQLYCKVKESVAEQLESVGVTTDIWSSSTAELYICLIKELGIKVLTGDVYS